MICDMICATQLKPGSTAQHFFLGLALSQHLPFLDTVPASQPLCETQALGRLPGTGG